MNDSGKVMSTWHVALCVRATATLAQTGCQIQKCDVAAGGAVLLWTSQLPASNVLVSDTVNNDNSFCLFGGPNLRESKYRPAFQIGDCKPVVPLSCPPRRVRR
jgi:hypothetical protein